MSEPCADLACGSFSCFSEPSGVPGLDLVAKRGSLTEADGRIPESRCHTAPRQGFHRNVGEAGAAQLGDDSLLIVITVRNSGQKARGVVGEHIGDCRRDEVCELIVFDPVPDIEDGEVDSSILLEVPFNDLKLLKFLS
jgi:hypothetical protein